MLEFTEAQLVELILVATKRGFKQAAQDAERKAEGEGDKYCQDGIDAFRRQALAHLRGRVSELKELKANDLLIAGFNEAAEFLEYGVESQWGEIKRKAGKEERE